MAKHGIKSYLKLFKDAFILFRENHPIKFASAIAYFSLFALPSILLIIVFVLGLIFSQQEILQELREQLSVVVGDEGAEILVVITQNLMGQLSESIITIVGYTVVVFWLSTQLFRLFKNSLNDLWRINPDYKSFWTKLWVERVVTFFFVIGTGLLFFASLILEKGLEFLISNSTEHPVVSTIVNIVTVFLVFLWFSMLYKYLPLVKLKWEPTFVGGAVTTLLFFAGYWILWYFVVERDLEDIYDFVAPIIVVALWIFYISLAFLYGASLTKVYARFRQKNIDPAPYAYKYKVVKEK